MKWNDSRTCSFNGCVDCREYLLKFKIGSYVIGEWCEHDRCFKYEDGEHCFTASCNDDFYWTELQDPETHGENANSYKTALTLAIAYVKQFEYPEILIDTDISKMRKNAFIEGYCAAAGISRPSCDHCCWNTGSGACMHDAGIGEPIESCFTDSVEINAR